MLIVGIAIYDYGNMFGLVDSVFVWR